MNGVEVLGNVRVTLIGEGCRKYGSCRVGHGIPIVGKVSNGPMALNVCGGWVSATVLLLKIDIANLDGLLDLIANVDISGNGDRVIGHFALECNLRLQTEDERGARCKRFRLVV